MTVTYSINGVLFSQLGLIVSSSEGVVDGLEVKDPFKVDWPDAHGEVVDLSRSRFQAREIKLTGFLKASSPGDFTSKLNALLTELTRPNTLRLRIDVVPSKPLVYEVYFKGGLKVEKKWRDGVMVGQFGLTLIEPQPVKWVLSNGSTQNVSMTVSAASPVCFYWGDGIRTEVQGSNQVVNHVYSGSSPYYLIISGELERMTFHSSLGLSEIWPRLY